MNRPFHYANSAAVLAESLVAAGVPKDRAATVAAAIARSDANTDEVTPAAVRCRDARFYLVPGITQIDRRHAARLVLRDDCYDPAYSTIHGWHFHSVRTDLVLPFLYEAYAFEPRPDRTIIAGLVLHSWQDCGLPTCPHFGLVGWPCRKNAVECWRRAKKHGPSRLARLAYRVARDIRQLDECAGHAFDPDCDGILRCRQGMLDCSWALWHGIAGRWSQELPPQSIRVILHAQSDEELGAMSATAFQAATGRELPAFRPILPGDELWPAWCAATAR